MNLASPRTYLGALLVTFGAASVLSLACGEAPDTESRTGLRQAALGEAVLGSAKTFAVLAGSTVTNTNATTVNGNLGVSPGLAITGFPPGIVIGGTVHAGDAVALQAQTDTTAAYGVLASAACDVDLTGKDLGGLTLKPGVYCFSASAQLTGALVLDAEGRADASFVFQTVSTLTTASNASVRVIGGGSACRVFWKVGSSATLGTETAFVGSVLALTSISLTHGATVSGRALARNGAVTMDDNAVDMGACGSAAVADAGVASAADAASPVDASLPRQDAASPADAASSADAASPADASVPPTDAGDGSDDGGTTPGSGS